MFVASGFVYSAIVCYSLRLNGIIKFEVRVEMVPNPLLDNMEMGEIKN
jgi:hypothetical protein